MRDTNTSGYRRLLTTGRVKARLTVYEKEIGDLRNTFMVSQIADH